MPVFSECYRDMNYVEIGLGKYTFSLKKIDTQSSNLIPPTLKILSEIACVSYQQLIVKFLLGYFLCLFIFF